MTYQKHKRYKQNQQTVPEVIVLGIFKAIAALFRLAFKRSAGKRGFSVSDRNTITARRLEIEVMLKSDNVHELKQAVFEADKLVDFTLMAKGYQGDTFADRLRSAQQYTDRVMYDEIWQGHRVRNQLAHDHGIQLSSAELKQAVAKLLKYVRNC